MMNKRKTFFRIASGIIAASLCLSLLGGCGDGASVRLDPKNPVTISVWHYYNGKIANSFDSLIKEFNETVGMEKGIIVEGYSHGNVSELEKSVISAANKEVGSDDVPNIFASYADTAYEAERMGILANLDTYFTTAKQAEYVDSYIEEGKIGLGGELRIFPIAKSTEVMMLNDTDWMPFAAANQLYYADISTVEGLARVSKLYYEWTDAQTPDVPNDGKAFFGRDSMANLFIISAMEYGTEIFTVSEGKAKIVLEDQFLRKIWDNYYIPFISGYYAADLRFRSDDAKIGNILAYVGSTTSASFFPKEVTIEDTTYPITAKVLPAPRYEDGAKVLVQQGAGMVVTKSTPQEEYASVVFLEWFTNIENNIVFSGLSGYLPVKKDANDYDKIISTLGANDVTLDNTTNDVLQIVLGEIPSSKLYTNKAFQGGSNARAILENDLQEKAEADRETVLALLGTGMTLEEAVARYNTDTAYTNWKNELQKNLEAAAQ